MKEYNYRNETGCKTFRVIEEVPSLEKGCYIIMAMNRDLMNRTLYKDQRLTSLLKTRSNIVYFMNRFIFQPQVDRIKGLRQWEAKVSEQFTIGLQVRTGNFSKGCRDNRGRLLESDVCYRIERALDLARGNRTDYHIFLATDSEEIQKQMLIKYNQTLLIYNEYEIGHTSHQHQLQQTDDYLYRAVADVYILAHCKVGIYSRSSFSDIALLLGKQWNQVNIKL